jgi:N-methylhydantoinase B
MVDIVNPFTVEIIRNSLIKACVDMRATIQRTSHSPVTYECVDLACGIVRPDLSLIAETSGVPAFLGNLVNAVNAIQRDIGVDNIEPEDVYFANDPYNGGGTHPNDVVVAYPIFISGELIAYSICKAHMMDVGGIYPGGWYNNTTDILQEGLRVPPVKLYRRGVEVNDIFRLLRTNSRLPDALEGDVHALVGAVRVGGTRVKELVEKYGYELYNHSVNKILDQSEAITREAIRAIPDGEYSAEFFLDGDGDDDKPLGQKLKVHVKVIIHDDEMTVDLSESNDASPGPINAPRPTSISYTRYAVKSITTPKLPSNEGCFRPLHIILRPGSMFDPHPPTPTSLWVEASQNIPDLILKALAPAIPDKVRAATHGSDIAEFTYGTDPRTKRYYIVAEQSTPGGWGGRPDSDGESGLHALAEGDTYNIPIEMMEVNFPLFVSRYEFIQDSGGPGKWRGGLGVLKTIAPVNHDAKFVATFDRSKYSPPWGLFGGSSGAPNRLEIHKKDGMIENHMKVTDMPLLDGESAWYFGGGGGGYGDPYERDPQLVLRDVKSGYVSVKKARTEYGVVIDLGTMTINEAATNQFRNKNQHDSDM